MRDDRGWPLSPEIQSREALRKDVPALVERGEWVCLSIEPSTAWPVRAQSLVFAGHEVWIIPRTQEEHPGVALNRSQGMSIEEAEGILYRLLSVISWRERTGLTVVHRSGGPWPMMMGMDRQRGFVTRQSFDFAETICPEEVRPRIALGLMREGRSLNHAGYAFLSFWRILELAFLDAGVRTSWMNNVLPNLQAHDLKEATESIRALGVDDVCRHLYSSGRCAIAHATGDPIVNPDDPRDVRRLARELPLVRELAVQAIEHQSGIDSPSKEYREHLYELRGWKRAIGPEMVSRIVAADDIGDDETIDLPVISVRLRDQPRYSGFEEMVPTGAHAIGGLLYLEYASRDGLAAIRFALHFGEERLQFDLANGLFGRDDGSVAAARHRVDARRFIRDMLLNGELQMWDAETGALVSRLDALIPVNCYIDLDASNASIDEAQIELDRRISLSMDGG